MSLWKFYPAVLLFAGLTLSPGVRLSGADHRGAPAADTAGEDDITDFYAFPSTSYLYQFKIDVTGHAKEDLVVPLRFRDDATAGQIAQIYIGAPDPNMVGASNQLLTNAPSQIEGPINQVFGGDGQALEGLRDDDPVVLDAQFFCILAGSQDVFRDIPTSPLGHLRGRPVKSGRTSGIARAFEPGVFSYQ